jgi:hypothetical protein
MARAQTAYLNRADVPDRKALQTAIKELGYKLTLDDAYAPFATKGYLPCTFDGEDAGFDLRFGEAEAASPTLAAALGGRDVAMIFRWGGDPREQFAAFAVCAALVDKFDAIIHEAEQDKIVTLDDLRAAARKLAEAL